MMSSDLSQEERLELQELKQELEEILETCQSKGWQLIHEEYVRMYDQLLDNAVLHCDTGDKWLQRRGTLVALKQLIDTQDNAEAALDELVNGEADDGRNPLED